jgi:hypothetical protein
MAHLAHRICSRYEHLAWFDPARTSTTLAASGPTSQKDWYPIPRRPNCDLVIREIHIHARCERVSALGIIHSHLRLKTADGCSAREGRSPYSKPWFWPPAGPAIARVIGPPVCRSHTGPHHGSWYLQPVMIFLFMRARDLRSSA